MFWKNEDKDQQAAVTAKHGIKYVQFGPSADEMKAAELLKNHKDAEEKTRRLSALEDDLIEILTEKPTQKTRDDREFFGVARLVGMLAWAYEDRPSAISKIKKLISDEFDLRSPKAPIIAPKSAKKKKK